MEFGNLIGKTLTKIEGEVGDGEMDFWTTEGEHYQLLHYQDCCEHVDIEDICGDLADLIGSPIVRASEDASGENPEGVEPKDYEESFTWTFYNIATAKGHVTIRWYGESNGCYSEGVDFEQIEVTN